MTALAITAVPNYVNIMVHTEAKTYEHKGLFQRHRGADRHERAGAARTGMGDKRTDGKEEITMLCIIYANMSCHHKKGKRERERERENLGFESVELGRKERVARARYVFSQFQLVPFELGDLLMP